MLTACWEILLIAVGTLISEDLTCITVALLIQDGRLGMGMGLVGCLLGIYVGDLGLSVQFAPKLARSRCW